MGKLDEVLKQLNQRLGNSAVQRASELVQSAEISLGEEKRGEEKIPPRPATPPIPSRPKPASPVHPGRIPGRYQPINVRKEEEPYYRVNYQLLRQTGQENTGGPFQAAVSFSERFEKQARCIREFSDDYPETEPFKLRYVSYMDLSLRQFRTYVTLRPRFLGGCLSDISEKNIGYPALYLSELFCGAAKETHTPAEIFAEAEEIYEYIRTLPFENPGERAVAVSCFDGWLFDYALIHQLETEAFRHMEKVRRLCSGEQQILAVKAALQRRDGEELLTLFDSSCPYHICSTAVCKKEPYRQIYPKLLTAVLAGLEQEMEKPLEELLLGRKFPRRFPLFERLEIRPALPENVSCTLSDGSVFRFREGRCEKETYVQLNTDWMAGLLRSIDFHFRLEAGTVRLKSSGLLSLSLDRKTGELVKAFCTEHGLSGMEQKIRAGKKKTASPKAAEMPRPVLVSIDRSRLAGIREDAAVLEERLLSVYTDREEELKKEELAEKTVRIPPVSPEPESSPGLPAAEPESEWKEFRAALTAEEAEYLRRLCAGEDAAGYLARLCAETGLLPELFWEPIHEKALEMIGDTLFDTEDAPEIYEDYREPLQAVFAGE